jgi:hypothetical protein
MNNAQKMLDGFVHPHRRTIDRFVQRRKRTRDANLTEMAENPDAHSVEALQQALSILGRTGGNEQAMARIKASIAKRG